MSISFSSVFSRKIKPSRSLAKIFIVSYYHGKFRGCITVFVVFTELSLIFDPHASPPSYERLSPGVPPSAPPSELAFYPQHNLHHSDVIFISANRSTSSIGSCVAAAICSILSLPRPINALAVDLADSARPSTRPSARPLARPSARPSRREPFISLT